MAQPFLVEYAATFREPGDFDESAKQMLLMDKRMRDQKTGLLRHGWDESMQMPWADKKTGLSLEAWARADGWYAMALVDVLDWIPKDHPQRAALIDVTKRTLASVARYQDARTGLWWQVMDKAGAPGNYPEASASCMFAYALAKGVRSRVPASTAMRSMPGAGGRASSRRLSGRLRRVPTLTGTVRVGGLGGKPYRSGDYAYYVHEKVQDDDPKGVGAYLKAGSGDEQAAVERPES